MGCVAKRRVKSDFWGDDGTNTSTSPNRWYGVYTLQPLNFHGIKDLGELAARN